MDFKLTRDFVTWKNIFILCCQIWNVYSTEFMDFQVIFRKSKVISPHLFCLILLRSKYKTTTLDWQRLTNSHFFAVYCYTIGMRFLLGPASADGPRDPSKTKHAPRSHRCVPLGPAHTTDKRDGGKTKPRTDTPPFPCLVEGKQEPGARRSAEATIKRFKRVLTGLITEFNSMHSKESCKNTIPFPLLSLSPEDSL